MLLNRVASAAMAMSLTALGNLRLGMGRRWRIVGPIYTAAQCYVSGRRRGFSIVYQVCRAGYIYHIHYTLHYIRWCTSFFGQRSGRGNIPQAVILVSDLPHRRVIP
jgi:hypothetical protein